MQTEIVSSPAPSTMHNNIDSRARELADIVLRGILQTQTLLPRDASNFNANPPQFRSPHNPLDISSCCPINPPAFPSPIPASCADQNEEWVHELLPALPFVTSTTDKLDVGQRPEITKFSQDAVITQPTCRIAKMSWNPSVNDSFASATLHNPTDRIGSSCMDDPYTSKTTPWKADGFGAAHEHSEPAFSEAFGTFPAFESFGIEHIPELLEVNKSNPSSSDNNSMAGASTSEQMDDDGFNTSNEAASANLLLRPGEVLPSQCAGTIPPGTVMGHPCQRTSCLPAMESTTFTMLPGFVGMSADQALIDSSSLKASPNLFSAQSNPLFSTIASSICDKASMKELVYRAAAFKPIDTIMEGMISKKKRKNVRISKDPQSVAARRRRERISYRIAILQRLVPGGTKMDTASMLDEAINYLKFLKMQVQSLERMEKWLSKMYWNHLLLGSHNNYVYNNNCNMNNDFFNNNNDNLYDIAATTTKTLSSTGTRAESTTATTRSATALHKNSAVTTATTTTTSS